MGYVVEQKSQINSELGLIMPRLKSFAVTLTGSEAKCVALVKMTRNYLLARIKERGHMPLPLWAFQQMHRIWLQRMNGAAAGRREDADPRLFQPRSRVNDGGASARFAMHLAKLSPVERGALHLVYGERLSYDEAAEIFEVPVSTVITRLAQCYATLGQSGNQDRPRAASGLGSRPHQDQTGPRGAERAA